MEQKINEMVEQSRILEAYMNDIINREATVTRLVGEARLSSTAIQNIVDENVVEALTPVGIGVYIKTIVPPIKRLLINVGAGVTVEKTREDAINYVEAKIKEFDLALRQLLSQKQQIAVRMEQIQALFEEAPTLAQISRRFRLENELNFLGEILNAIELERHRHPPARSHRIDRHRKL